MQNLKHNMDFYLAELIKSLIYDNNTIKNQINALCEKI